MYGLQVRTLGRWGAGYTERERERARAKERERDAHTHTRTHAHTHTHTHTRTHTETTQTHNTHTQDTSNLGVWSFFYFVMLIILGPWLAVNLFLVVISTQYDATAERCAFSIVLSIVSSLLSFPPSTMQTQRSARSQKFCL
jgi:uncharacterized membrane protein